MLPCLTCSPACRIHMVSYASCTLFLTSCTLCGRYCLRRCWCFLFCCCCCWRFLVGRGMLPGLTQSPACMIHMVSCMLHYFWPHAHSVDIAAEDDVGVLLLLLFLVGRGEGMSFTRPDLVACMYDPHGLLYIIFDLIHILWTLLLKMTLLTMLPDLTYLRVWGPHTS